MNEQMYKELIVEHAKHPVNEGKLEDATDTYTELNPLCGDKITIFLNIENNILKEVTFENEGCAISTAAASMVSEKIRGMSIEIVKSLGKECVLEELGVSISSGRIKCATLFLKAVQKALEKKNE